MERHCPAQGFEGRESSALGSEGGGIAQIWDSEDGDMIYQGGGRGRGETAKCTLPLHMSAALGKLGPWC